MKNNLNKNNTPHLHDASLEKKLKKEHDQFLERVEQILG